MRRRQNRSGPSRRKRKGRRPRDRKAKATKPSLAPRRLNLKRKNRPREASQDATRQRRASKSALLSLPHLRRARRQVPVKLRSSVQRPALAYRPNPSQTTTHSCRATIFLIECSGGQGWTASAILLVSP